MKNEKHTPWELDDLKKSVSVSCWENFQKGFESSEDRPLQDWWNIYSAKLSDVTERDSVLASLWFDNDSVIAVKKMSEQINLQQTDEEEDEKAANPEEYENRKEDKAEPLAAMLPAVIAGAVADKVSEVTNKSGDAEIEPNSSASMGGYGGDLKASNDDKEKTPKKAPKKDDEEEEVRGDGEGEHIAK